MKTLTVMAWSACLAWAMLALDAQAMSLALGTDPGMMRLSLFTGIIPCVALGLPEMVPTIWVVTSGVVLLTAASLLLLRDALRRVRKGVL